MEKSLARPADEIEIVVKTYGNMLFRLCLVMLGTESDAEAENAPHFELERLAMRLFLAY